VRVFVCACACVCVLVRVRVCVCVDVVDAESSGVALSMVLIERLSFLLWLFFLGCFPPKDVVNHFAVHARRYLRFFFFLGMPSH
jgi:hypothetical protein